MSDENIIHDLTPTESLMILQPSFPRIRLFIKYGILELINLKVLAVYRDFAGSPGFPTVKDWYVSRGELFNQAICKCYHKDFVKIFEDNDKRIPLRSYRQLVYKNIEWGSFKKDLVYKLLLKQGFYKDTILSSVGVYILSKKGMHIKQLINERLERLDKTIDKKNRKILLSLCNELGLNIFLSDKVNSRVLKEISKATKSFAIEGDYNNLVNGFNCEFKKFRSVDLSYDTLDFGGRVFGGGGSHDYDLSI